MDGTALAGSACALGAAPRRGPGMSASIAVNFRSSFRHIASSFSAHDDTLLAAPGSCLL